MDQATGGDSSGVGGGEGQGLVAGCGADRCAWGYCCHGFGWGAGHGGGDVAHLFVMSV